MNDTGRAFDIVLMGATGFTGRLVAAHLERVATNLRWAIAGRNAEKLTHVVDTISPSASVMIADSTNPSDMQTLAKQTKVVASTAGPFAKIGTALVAACAQQGTHYVDITGETQWIRHTIDTYDEPAKASGSRIIHCCGFDSVPSDLGVMVLADLLRPSDFPIDILGIMTRLKGGLSGGTLASMQNVLHEAKDRDVARLLRHPFSLNPLPLPKLREPTDQLEAVHIPELKMWSAPFVMAAINTRIVRRSEALRGYSPTALHYHENLRAANRLKAMTLATGMKAGIVTQALAPTRALTKAFLPRPGEGPTDVQMENGYFELSLYGRLKGASQYTHRVVVSADSDPGYSATAKMLGEAAICAQNPMSSSGGVQTPSIALGTAFVRRLEDVGITFVPTQLLD